MDNQRFILFIILSALILMLWSAWEAENRTSTDAARATNTTATPLPSTPPAAAARTPDTKTLERAERINVTTDLLDIQIDTMGGDIRVADLLKHPVALDQPKKPFRLLNDTDSDLYIAQSGLLARDTALPNHRTRYSSEASKYQLVPGTDVLEVRLNWSGSDGLKVSKIYTFRRNDYVVDVRYEASNNGRKLRELYLYTQFLRHHIDPGTSLTTLPTYTGGVVYTPDKKYEKIDFEQMRKKSLARDADGGWIAMLQHYFVGAWLPAAKDRVQYYTDAQGNDNFAVGYKTLNPVTAAPGEKATLKTQLYIGPKEQHRLEKAAEGLVLTVDYGWLTLIASPLFWLLEWFHKLVNNWGWSIILLTLLIKLVFYPLSVASYRSMAQMKKLQPRMQQLKERYKDDRQKFQQAMMEIYKTEKINPLGGCLPIVIQIPVFIALYWVLLESVELRLAPWALWIKDLSSPDPYFVLPILMGATMLAQQWLNPQPLEDLQKKIMYALPVVFTFMFLFFPSGLVLYWVVQNILSIAQQWQITRAVESKK